MPKDNNHESREHPEPVDPPSPMKPGQTGISAMRGDTDQAQAPHDSTEVNDKDVIISGKPEQYAKYGHLQGENDFGVTQDCGIVAVENVLQQKGVHVSENDLVQFARTHDIGEHDGGTTMLDQEMLLEAHGVAAHMESGRNINDLAEHVDRDSGVIAEVNAGTLWNDPDHYDNGAVNHAINVTGATKDIQTNEVKGFYINDSGTGESGKYINRDLMSDAWEKPGGKMVVTDLS